MLASLLFALYVDFEIPDASLIFLPLKFFWTLPWRLYLYFWKRSILFGYFSEWIDLTKQISQDYGVLLAGPGLALQRLFIIDPNESSSIWASTISQWAEAWKRPSAWWRHFSLWKPMEKSAQPNGPQILLQSSPIQLLPKNTVRR